MKAKRALVAVGIAGALAAAGVYAFRTVGDDWLKRRLLDRYVGQLRQQLPFALEKLEVHGKLSEIAASGRVPRIEAVLSWRGYRLRVDGPLELTKGESRGTAAAEGSITFWSPATTIEPASAKEAKAPGAVSLPFDLAITGTATLDPLKLSILELKRLSVRVAAEPRWAWQLLGLEIDDLDTEVSWEPRAEGPAGGPAAAMAGDLPHGVGRVRFAAKAATWSRPAQPDRPELTFNVEKPRLDAWLPLRLSTLVSGAGAFRALGPEAHLELRTQGLEALLGERYLSLDLSRLPLRAQARIGETGFLPESIAVKAGEGATQARKPLVEIDAALPPGAKTLSLSWRTRDLPKIGDLIAPFRDQPEFAPYRELELIRGQVETRGKARLPWPLPFGQHAKAVLEDSAVEGTAGIRGLALRFGESAVGGLDVQFPLELLRAGTHRIRVSSKALYYKHFRGALGPWDLSVTHRPGPPGTPSRLALEAPPPPLKLDGVALSFGPLKGSYAPEKPDSPPRWKFDTSLELKPTSLRTFLAGTCSPGVSTAPEGIVRASLPTIAGSPDIIDPSGTARIELFGGAIELSRLAYFPATGDDLEEIHFTAVWDSLQLSAIGAWAGLGDMQGILTGYAKDVVLEGPVLSRYNLHVRTAPYKRRKIYFSTDAMQSVVRLFTGQEELPGIAQWMAFGWPSRFLGGYDVEFVGINARSLDGTITIESITPPEILKKENGKHFILYSPRFRIPLQSAQYPILVDAPALARTLNGMLRYFTELAAAKKVVSALEKPEENPDEKAQCLPPSP